MSLFRRHQRSSDSVDFEHTATLRDMEELSLAEKSHESPLEQPPAPPAQVAFSLSSPVPTQHGDHASRSTSQTFQTDAREKLVIFKDDAEPVAARNPQQSAPSDCRGQLKSSPSRMSRRKTIRSVSDPPVTQAGALPTISSLDAPIQGSSHLGDHYKRSTISPPAHLVSRLQEISAKRMQLLSQLSALQEEEDVSLAQLRSSTDPANVVSTQCTFEEEEEEEDMDTTTFRPAKPLFGKPPAFPLPVPTKTLRTLSPSKLPLSRPHHARTNSTPTTVRHRAASTVKRTPLTDKTEDSLASFVPSPFIPEEPFSAEETGEQVYDQNMRDRATTTRVALNFGSDDDTTKDRRPYSRGGGKSRSRGRSRDSTATRDRSRSRGVGSVCGRRPRAAPRAATPARLPQACDIPYTVARKKWDF